MGAWDYAHCLPYFKKMETGLASGRSGSSTGTGAGWSRPGPGVSSDEEVLAWVARVARNRQGVDLSLINKEIPVE